MKTWNRSELIAVAVLVAVMEKLINVCILFTTVIKRYTPCLKTYLLRGRG